MNRRRNLMIAGIAFIVILALTFGYVAIANPPWSPIPAFKGDGKGTSQTEKIEQEKQQVHEEAEQRLNGSLALVPGDAFVVSHANLSNADGGNAWWDTYARMLPPTLVLPQDLPDNLGVTSLTYASYPNGVSDYSGFVPVSYEVVLTSPADKGEAVREYLATNKDANSFVHYVVRGDTAFIVLSDVTSYDQVAALVADDKAPDTFEDSQQVGNFDVDQTSPAMYVDVSAYFDLMASYKPDAKDFTNQLFNQGLGLKADTTWLGSTTDQGLTWNGKFLSGGIDKDAVDPEKFQQILNAQIELIPGGGSEKDGVGVEYGYVNLGMSTVGDALSVAKGGVTSGAVVNPHNMGAEPVVADAQGSDITIVFSPQMFQAAYQGVLDSSSIHTITATVSGEDVTMVFDFYEASDFAG